MGCCTLSSEVFGGCVHYAMTLPLLLWLAQGHVCPSVCMCQQCRERQRSGAQELSLFLVPSPFPHARRVVKDRVRAKGQEIDYPVCRKCIQGLCRQDGNKAKASFRRRSETYQSECNYKTVTRWPADLCWYSKCWITPVYPNSALIWGLMCCSRRFPSCYVTRVLYAPLAHDARAEVIDGAHRARR